MNDYYLDFFREMEEAVSEGKLNEALILIDKELSMPYVPAEAEEKLKRMRRDVVYSLSEKKEIPEVSLGHILDNLKSEKQEVQLAAANLLSERNLRGCVEELRAYLENDPFPEAAALVMEAIAEQEIGEEFILRKNDVEYTFWGDAVIPVAKSGGFLEALNMIETYWNKQPALVQMARMCLIHKAYLFLPLSYDKQDAELLFEEVREEMEELLREENSKRI